MAAFLLALVAAAPASASSPPGAYTDPAGDQSTSGPLHVLKNNPAYAGAACRDPVFDVIGADVSVGSTHLTVAVTFDDLAGTPSCGPLPLDISSRVGVVHLYFNYSAGGYPGSSGYYLYWHHDAAGTLCAGLYSQIHPNTNSCLPGLGSASLSGNTLTWTFPLSGSIAVGSTTITYALQEPLSFYGVTYSNFNGGELSDTYAW